MRAKDEEWALFWCGLLHPVLFGEIEPDETHRYLQELAQEERLFPNGIRKKPSLSTLKRKLKKYREGGFDALARKIRTDRGKSRAHTDEIIEKAIAIKRDQARRSHVTINGFLRTQHGKTLPKSTLYRHLCLAGATRLKLGVLKKKVRRRWTRDHTHALWVGDFENGPYVLHGDQIVETHLSAFIDCHSRFIVEARYYVRENLDILIDSLLRAWATHGASWQLYLDNAKIYHAKALKTACYRLTIELLHRQARDPPGGGLIERFFKTAQDQFEAEVRAGDLLSLEQLNRAFSAWLEMSYHRTPNSETGQSPKERYELGLSVIRRVDLQVAARCFMKREARSVHKDFSDVQLSRRFYRVDGRLRGDRVVVHYDPFSSGETVLIYSLRDEYLGKGVLHRRERGEDPSPPSPPTKPQYNYLELLVAEHENELKARAQGIDYRKALGGRPGSFSSFAKALARLLGRREGLTSFTTAELEVLQNLYTTHPSLRETDLPEAVERAQEKTFPYVVFELQKLHQRKD